MTVTFTFEPSYFVQIKYNCPCHGYGWHTILLTNVLDKAKSEISRQVNRRGCGCERGLRIVDKLGEQVQ